MNPKSRLPLALLLAGCSGGAPGLGIGDGAGAIPDLQAEQGVPDAASSDGGCRVYTQRVMTLDRIDPIEAVARLGAHLRVRVTYRSTTCSAPGPTEVGFRAGNATDAATLLVHSLEPSGPGCADTTVVRTVTLSERGFPISNPTLILLDGAAGGTARLALDVLPALPPPTMGRQCVVSALGQPCVSDCQCAVTDGGRCLFTTAAGGVCALPCSEDTDCPDSAPRCGAAQIAPFVCGIASCADDRDCYPGQRCLPVGANRACRPDPDPYRAGSCSCSGAVCGAALLCVNQPPPHVGTFCGLPCESDRDCVAVGQICGTNGLCQAPGG